MKISHFEFSLSGAFVDTCTSLSRCSRLCGVHTCPLQHLHTCPASIMCRQILYRSRSRIVPNYEMPCLCCKELRRVQINKYCTPSPSRYRTKKTSLSVMPPLNAYRLYIILSTIMHPRCSGNRRSARAPRAIPRGSSLILRHVSKSTNGSFMYFNIFTICSNFTPNKSLFQTALY